MLTYEFRLEMGVVFTVVYTLSRKYIDSNSTTI